MPPVDLFKRVGNLADRGPMAGGFHRQRQPLPRQFPRAFALVSLGHERQDFGVLRCLFKCYPQVLDPWGMPYMFDADYMHEGTPCRAIYSGGPNKSGLNVYDVLKHEHLILTVPAVEKVKERLA